MNWMTKEYVSGVKRGTFSVRVACALLFCVLAIDASQLLAQADAKATSPAAAKGAAAAPDTRARVTVATVNGQPIYQDEVDNTLAQMLRGQKYDRSMLPTLRAGMLAQVIDQRIMSDYITREKLGATPAEIEAEIQKVRDELRKKNITLEQRLAETGQTLQKVQSDISTEMAVKKYITANATQEKVAEYFAKNAKQFDGSRVHVRHILFRPTRNGSPQEMKQIVALAGAVKKEIESGNLTFVEAARKYSEGPSRQAGGSLGAITRDGPLQEEFKAAAFKLEPDAISEPVMTNSGIHLILVTGIDKGAKSLADVRDQIAPAFAKSLLEELLETERAAANVTYNERFPHFKPGTRELAGAN
ncbi:MAG: peptidylprolyl isomerase [Planctomycetota bacterium]|nr:peptidylprolyl isomerase [Planctomycetota bacterium]